MRRTSAATALGFSVLLLANVSPTQASSLLSGTFSKNIASGPIGPFLADESVVIYATVRNESISETISICPGVCIGDVYTYSLGGIASVPNGYSFFFGNDPTVSGDAFDEQVVGTLAPGQEKDFVFGVYSPGALIQPGWYSFGTALQIFEASADRPMLSSPSFGGRWEVVGELAVPEPTTLALFGLGLAAFGAVRRRKLAA